MAERRFKYKSELTVSCESNARNKNYLGVAMSILVLMLISSMIVAAIVIINPDIVNFANKPYGPHEAITLEESLLNELSANTFASQWLASIGSNGEIVDELLIEDSKNLNIVTMPPSGRQSNNRLRQMTDANNVTTASAPSSGIGASSQLTDTVRFERFHQMGSKTTASSSSLVTNMSLLASLEYQGFKLSPSRRYLLIWTNKRRRFRHSFTAKYFIYDIKLDLILMLSTKPPPENAADSMSIDEMIGPANFPHNTFENLDSATHNLNVVFDDSNDNKYTRFQWVEWFESSEEYGRDSLVLFQSNDIFLIKSVANKNVGDISASETSQQQQQQHITPIRITFTGKPEEIFNGLPDWLYEEEILGPGSAFQISPSANTLAYMSFNDSQVDIMPYTLYGPSEQVIPKIQQIRYPKVGKVNPQVRVHLVDNWLDNKQSNDDIELELPKDLANRQHYINRIKWLSNDNLALIWLNRHQNESYFVICSRNTQWKCEKNLHLKADGGWLDLADDLTPIDDEHYLALLFKFEGPEVGSFKHIARVSLKQSDTFTFITNGRKEIISIDGLDRVNSLVYYTSTVVDEPGQRQLFTVSMNNNQYNAIGGGGNGGGGGGEENCITCDHYPSECLYNYAKMSPSTNYYIFECEGPGIPRTELRTTKPIDEPLPVPLELKSTDGSGVKEQQPSLRNTNNNNNINNIHISTGNTANKNSIGSGNRATSASASLPSKDSTLLWIMENNQALRDKLQRKAIPLTMRLKVPIANTNYSANVIMLLPPEFGSTTTFRSPTAAFLSQSARPGRARPRRGALPVPGVSGGSGSGGGGLERPIHAHFTPESIADYTSQLPTGQQYPMVVDVYAGPAWQKVDYRYNINFGHYLTSSRRTIYVMIDGRGSGFEGTKRMYEMYNKFGTVEIQDQIEVANYLRRNFSFIDPNRIGIWGWSYGGYAAAMALAQSNAQSLRDLRAQLSALQMSNTTTSHLAREMLSNGGNISPATPSSSSIHHQNQHHPHSLKSPASGGGGVFECAVSVAPVTNWIYYDTAYTERYMSSPYLNELFDEHKNGDHNYQRQVESDDGRAVASNLTRPQSGNKWIPLNRIVPNNNNNNNNNNDSQKHRRTTTANSSNSSSITMMRNNNQMGSSSSPLISVDLNERYRRASLLEHIANIDRKRFLLIHGSADDNVHFQQSIMLMRKLINKNIMYETRIYPDQDHGIANKADKLHLGSTLSNFFAECFDMAY